MYYRRFGRRESLLSFLGPGVVYLVSAFGIGYIFWPYFYYIKGEHIIAVGLFTLWRYTWLFANYIRSLIYHHMVYPRLKRRAMALWNRKNKRPHLYFVIPSYMEEPWITVEMLQSILSELSKVNCTATLVVATASDEEDRLFANIFEAHPVSDSVELVLQRQSEGKRIAMGDALRAVARRYYKDEDYDSVTILMDGDTVVAPGVLEKVLAFFVAYPNLGALTTNEVAYISSSSRWYKDWFNMKFGQRHILFGSHALSRRVLTLTGRFSAFRTAAVVREEFIKRLERDYLEHPLEGRFRFLMGDDKSTWFQMLKEKWDMLYLPDAICYAMESRKENFIKVSLQLLFRWYGNTLRNNKRALALGADGVGGRFIWLAILDQKLSMWTSLVGITAALTLSFALHPVYLPIYLAWVLLVRTVQMGAIAAGGHPVSYRTIPLMLYNQWIGALVKIWVNFHLAHQSWKKGKAVQDFSKWWVRVKHPLAPVMPKLAMFVSTVLFVFAICLSEGILDVPDFKAFASAATGFRVEGMGKRINEAIEKAKSGAVLKLPKGRVLLDGPIVVSKSNITLEGDKTTIVLTKSCEAALLIKGERVKLKGLLEDAERGSSIVHLLNRVKEGDILLFRRPNDDAFLKSIHSLGWNKRFPYVRQEVFEVKGVKNGEVLLDRSLFFDFPADETEVFLLKGARNITVRNITVIYKPEGEQVPPPHLYKNLLPGDKTDLVKVEFASNIRLENLTLLNAGRHPLNLDTVYRVSATNIKIDGAWNKGKGGNGYLRLARSFACRIEKAEVKNIRHITIQWSSAYNTLRHIYSQVDINFHGGYPHHNLVEDVVFAIPEVHPWKGVVFIPDDAAFAPPNGPENRVIGAVFEDQ